MNILGICSATNSSSVALVSSQKILGEHFFNHSVILSENMVSYIERLLSSAQVETAWLQGVAVTRGPGGFTNLRVGITAAKTLAQILNIPVAGIDALDCVARNCTVEGTLLVIQKACRNEMNVAVYGCMNQQYHKQTPNFAITREQLAGKLDQNQGPLYLTGDGAGEVHALLTTTTPIYLMPSYLWEPRAAVVASLGRMQLIEGNADALLTLNPNYSHAPNIKKTHYGKNLNIA